MPEPHERFVVTGGAGFIGSHLVDALLDRGASEVAVIDNLSRGSWENLSSHRGDRRLREIDGDIRDPAKLAAVIDEADTVFHLAAQATVMGAAQDLDYTFTTNVVGTYNVLRAAAEAGARRVVFSSSREVYGEPLALPVHESHPLLAINMYGSSKVAGEALCRAFAHELGLEAVILRIANVFGPRDHGRVIPQWIDQARAGKPLIVYGGAQVIDFVWVGHVVEAMLRAADADVALPPINVASGTGTRILDLARRIVQLCGRSTEITIVPGRRIEVTRFIGGPERMSELLGVTPAADPLSELSTLIRPTAGAAA
jgi:nucleoside-diphosphate-sugar epimerase